MQICPGCDTPLPDQASFCARCGHAIGVAENKTPQTLEKPGPSDQHEINAKLPETQALSEEQNTPQSDEVQQVEEPMVSILPPSQDILLPIEASNADGETHPTPLDTPHPAPTPENDGQTTLASPAFEDAPLPAEPIANDDTPRLTESAASNDNTALPTELITSNDTPLPAEPIATNDAPRLTESAASDDTPLPVEPIANDDVSLPLEPITSNDAPLPLEPAASEDVRPAVSAASNDAPLPLEPAASEDKSDLETLPVVNDTNPGMGPQLTTSDEESDLEALPTTNSAEPDLEALLTTSEAKPDSEALPAASNEKPDLDVASNKKPDLEALPAASDEKLNLDAASEAKPDSEALPTASDLETLPTASNEKLNIEALPAANDEKPDPETLPTTSNEKPSSDPLALPQTPLPSLPETDAEQPDLETQAPPKAPSPARVPSPEDQKARVLPSPARSSPAPKVVSNYRAEIADQETRDVPIVRKTPVLKPGTSKDNTDALIRTVPSAPLPKPAPKPVRTIGALIWSLISPIFKRARDTEPEKPKAPLPQFTLLGWLPIIALTSALGLFTTTIAFNAARNNTPGAEFYYWMGVGIIYIPVVVRLIMPYSSRAERVGLLAVVTICLFLTKVSLSPLYYSGYDEFLHWRTINDILSTGHLFTKNPLLPVSPFYPGLEIVTSALSNISGMTSIQAGFTVVGVANLMTILSLFLLAELLSGSSRLASITAVIYMANPHFLFFDTQFAYESLAIPLALVVMLAMTRYETLKRGRPWVLLVAWTVLAALDLTHHATNFVFEGLFLLWAIVYLFLRPLPLRKSIVLPTVIAGLALTVTTILVIGNIVISYFTSFFADISSEVAKDLGSAGSSSRQLFGGGAVIQTPLWERLISLGSVGLITLAIPFLLLCFWRRYRRNTLVWVFAIIIIFYPVLQVLRLTTSGAEISDRASAFIFIAISFLGAVAIVQFWPVRLFNWKHSAVITTAILVLFMGGIILGEGIPPTFLPGLYEASADARSIDAEGIQAALWADTYLGPNQRMYTDRINQLLMSVYGDQYLVTKIGDNVDVTDVIFDPTFGKYEISRLQAGRVHYLAIDMRLTTQLPQDGFYYEQGESTTGPNGDTTAINPGRLTKFDGVPGINRFYDSGNMVIYDTGGVINVPPVP